MGVEPSFFDQVELAWRRRRVKDYEMIEQASWTAPSGSYPRFINVMRIAEGVVRVSVRGPAVRHGDGVAAGPQVEVELPVDDWHQLLSDMVRLG